MSRPGKLQGSETDELVRDLHDQVLQPLMFMVAGGYGQLDATEEYRELAEQATDALRRIINGSCSTASLRDALTSIDADLVLAAEAPQLDIEVEDTCATFAADSYRALVGATREALANAMFHSHGREVQVRGWVTEEEILVTVSDDGIGLGAGWNPGFGTLQCIANRMREAGGGALTEPSPQGGARVILWHPRYDRVSAVGV
jgi:signal transduction histidine kinase